MGAEQYDGYYVTLSRYVLGVFSKNLVEAEGYYRITE